MPQSKGRLKLLYFRRPFDLSYHNIHLNKALTNLTYVD